MDQSGSREFGRRIEISGGQGVMPLNIANFGDVWTPDCGLDKA
jgi:hypothetical protein